MQHCEQSEICFWNQKPQRVGFVRFQNFVQQDLADCPQEMRLDLSFLLKKNLIRNLGACIL
jgi:hypothetical protein